MALTEKDPWPDGSSTEMVQPPVSTTKEDFGQLMTDWVLNTVSFDSFATRELLLKEWHRVAVGWMSGLLAKVKPLLKQHWIGENTTTVEINLRKQTGTPIEWADRIQHWNPGWGSGVALAPADAFAPLQVLLHWHACRLDCPSHPGLNLLDTIPCSCFELQKTCTPS
jgi:hypothetical protein